MTAGRPSAGLFAAIPAVVGYNYYTNRINHMAVELGNFVNEFLNLVERNITKRV